MARLVSDTADMEDLADMADTPRDTLQVSLQAFTARDSTAQVITAAHCTVDIPRSQYTHRTPTPRDTLTPTSHTEGSALAVSESAEVMEVSEVTEDILRVPTWEAAAMVLMDHTSVHHIMVAWFTKWALSNNSLDFLTRPNESYFVLKKTRFLHHIFLCSLISIFCKYVFERSE